MHVAVTPCGEVRAGANDVSPAAQRGHIENRKPGGTGLAGVQAGESMPIDEEVDPERPSRQTRGREAQTVGGVGHRRDGEPKARAGALDSAGVLRRGETTAWRDEHGKEGDEEDRGRNGRARTNDGFERHSKT